MSVRPDPPYCRSLLGFTEDDRLSHDQVGLYRFTPSPDGVTIEEIPYDPNFGYSEEEFYDVAESISDQTYDIESRLPVPVG